MNVQELKRAVGFLCIVTAFVLSYFGAVALVVATVKTFYSDPYSCLATSLAAVGYTLLAGVSMFIMKNTRLWFRG